MIGKTDQTRQMLPIEACVNNAVVSRRIFETDHRNFAMQLQTTAVEKSRGFGAAPRIM